MYSDKHSITNKISDVVDSLRLVSRASFLIVHKNNYSVITIGATGKEKQNLLRLIRLEFSGFYHKTKGNTITIQHKKVPAEEVRSPAEKILDMNPSLLLETVLDDIDQ